MPHRPTTLLARLKRAMMLADLGEVFLLCGMIVTILLLLYLFFLLTQFSSVWFPS